MLKCNPLWTWPGYPHERPDQQGECILCHHVGHWIPGTSVQLWEIFLTLTAMWTLQDVHIDSVWEQQPPEAVCWEPQIGSARGWANALASSGQSRWPLPYTAATGVPDTLPSGLHTQWGEKWSSCNHWQLKNNCFKCKRKYVKVNNLFIIVFRNSFIKIPLITSYLSSKYVYCSHVKLVVPVRNAFPPKYLKL